jgi:sulfite exporter TauE/SafE
MTALLTGIVVGLAGSGHCAGMCGPLVLAIGRRLAPPSRRAEVGHALLYQTGRVATYAALAIPAGLVGQALVLRGLGRVVALGAGILLLMWASASLRPRAPGRLASACAGGIARAAGPVRRWATTQPFAGPLVTGAVNGLLPCGLVYAALTMAAAAGSAGDAVLLMIGFGLGTSAVLLAIVLWAAALPLALRMRLRRLEPLVLVAAAVLLIARALATAGMAHH